VAPEVDSWESWSRYLRSEIERQGKALDELNAKVDDIRMEIATLKVKAGVWGAVADVLAGLVAVLIAIGMRLTGH
jgi:hypothetical protein